MSNQSNDTVFPREGKYRGAYGSEIVVAPALGLTKRELFAAMAMQGFCANETVAIEWSEETIAINAARQADALLTALEKSHG